MYEIELLKEVISGNPYAIVKSGSFAGSIIMQTIEVDEEGCLWCWLQEDEEDEDKDSFEKLCRMEHLPVCLKYANKSTGQYLVAYGNADFVNFFPATMAHLCQQTQSGYLWKVSVKEFEYFEKKRLSETVNILKSVKQYSLALVEKLNNEVNVKGKHLLSVTKGIFW